MDRKDKIISYFIKIIEDMCREEYKIERYSLADEIKENGYDPIGEYRNWITVNTKWHELTFEYPPGIGVPEVICFKDKITGEEFFINYQ